MNSLKKHLLILTTLFFIFVFFQVKICSADEPITLSLDIDYNACYGHIGGPIGYVWFIDQNGTPACGIDGLQIDYKHGYSWVCDKLKNGGYYRWMIRFGWGDDCYGDFFQVFSGNWYYTLFNCQGGFCIGGDLGNKIKIESDTKNDILPKDYELNQNYPNPFNPTTNIKFAIPKNGNASLKVYDALGRLVTTYYDGFITAGYYKIEVDASSWSSGVYFYTLYTTDFVQTKKMTVIK